MAPQGKEKNWAPLAAHVKRTLTPEQFTKALQHLGLDDLEMAELLNMGRNGPDNLQRMRAGERGLIVGHLVAVVELATQLSDLYQQLRKLAELQQVFGMKQLQELFGDQDEDDEDDEDAPDGNR